MVKLRSVGLTPAYRKSRHEAGLWLWLLVAELGMPLHKGLRPQVIDRWLAKAVQEAFDRGFKLYQATLGVLALQQAYGLSGPLLRNTWAAVKGWRTVQVSKPRIPLTKYRLECIRWSWSISVVVGWTGLVVGFYMSPSTWRNT